MTKKGHQKCWQMKRHIFWEKSHGKVSLARNFFLESKKIVEIGEKMLHCLRGMDAPDSILITPIY